MAEIATHFPPQTYSSSFYLNSIAEDEKELVVTGCPRKSNSKSPNGTPLLDCFISAFLFGERRPSADDKLDRLHEGGEKDLEKVRKYGRTGKPLLGGTQQIPRSGFKRWRRSGGKDGGGVKTADANGTASEPKRVENKEKNRHDEDMMFLKFLAINALDLSAPASDVLLKSRNSSWFQLSGHPDSLAPAGPGTVWKKRSGCHDDTERTVYEHLSKDPNIKDIIPRYYREVDYQGEKFIELQNLLHGFQDPFVMDIKMGTRTFLESEVKKNNPRPDLYQKMIAIDPQAPSEEEHEEKAVTKLRYMQFREQQSSSCRQGFRIEAMKCRGSPPVTDLKKVKSRDEVLNTMDLFLRGRSQTSEALLQRLKEIRVKIEESEYFKAHEVIGSSVFMIYDDSKVGVWLIDFAKTNKLPEGLSVNHRAPWVQGNHEEGLLFGLDQLISVIEELKDSPTKKKETNSFSKMISAISAKS